MGVATPLRVLVLCTGNSARSQIAEALLGTFGGGRVIAASAGTTPAPRVNPYAVRVLAERGIAWEGHTPKSVDDVIGQPWDIMITVCDHAKESCPVFPGARVTAHWGMPDPAEVTGPDDAKLDAFRTTLAVLEARIRALLALALESLDTTTLRGRVAAIAETGA